MADLSVQYMGFKLRNPLILASGPLSDGVERCRAYAEAGVSAITLKSLFHRGMGELRWKHATPRYRVVDRLRPTQRWNPKTGIDNIGVVGWGEGGSCWKEEKYGWFIDQVKEAVGDEVKIGASLAGSPSDIASWDEYLDIFKNSRADYVEVNMGYDRYYRNPEQTERIIKKVRRALSIPFGVKLPPFAGFMNDWARRFQDWGADSVIMFDKGWGLYFDLDLKFPNWQQGTWNYCPFPSGTGLPWVLYNVMLARRKSGVTKGISASMDVWSWEDIIKCLMSGADTVQVHTRFMIRGPKEAASWLKSVNKWLDDNGHPSLYELKGRVFDHLIEPFTDQDAPRHVPVDVGGAPPIKAVVDRDKCKGCLDLCTRCCMFSAVSGVDKKAQVEEAKCDACGLCVSLCPREAISFQPR